MIHFLVSSFHFVHEFAPSCFSKELESHANEGCQTYLLFLVLTWLCEIIMTSSIPRYLNGSWYILLEDKKLKSTGSDVDIVWQCHDLKQHN